jgi:hypothetical protein
MALRTTEPDRYRSNYTGSKGGCGFMAILGVLSNLWDGSVKDRSTAGGNPRLRKDKKTVQTGAEKF